jgi:hypothetical protein
MAAPRRFHLAMEGTVVCAQVSSPPSVMSDKATLRQRGL